MIFLLYIWKKNNVWFWAQIKAGFFYKAVANVADSLQLRQKDGRFQEKQWTSGLALRFSVMEVVHRDGYLSLLSNQFEDTLKFFIFL